MTAPMVGKTYRFDMGWLRVRFTFVSPSQGRFVVEEGGGLTPNGHAETVALDLKEIRDDVYLNSWGEACGTTVTHVVDLANATVYANVTVDGTLYNFVGTFTEVTDVPIADRSAIGSGQTERTTEIVLTAMRELFADRDRTAAPGLRESTWDLQRIAAQDDLVFTHSIVHGWAPGPVAIVDIFRLENGRIVEHWDVVQDLVPTRSVPDGAPGHEPAQITSPSERTTAMNDQDQHEVTVRDNPDESRFDVFVEDTHAGLSAYKDLGETQRVFYHTVVFDEFGGRGLAGALTRTALSTSIQAGHRIVAVCPYVKKWLATHHDFDDATDPVGREHLRALR